MTVAGFDRIAVFSIGVGVGLCDLNILISLRMYGSFGYTTPYPIRHRHIINNPANIIADHDISCFLMQYLI